MKSTEIQITEYFHILFDKKSAKIYTHRNNLLYSTVKILPILNLLFANICQSCTGSPVQESSSDENRLLTDNYCLQIQELVNEKNTKKKESAKKRDLQKQPDQVLY